MFWQFRISGKKVHCTWVINYQKSKSVTSMELEQRHIIKFLHLKGLKLRKIDAELSSPSGQDVPPRRALNIGFIRPSSGEPTCRRNMLANDHLSTILTLKSYQFFEGFHFPHCERLLTPGIFVLKRSIFVWLKRLDLTIC
jgi:hypothetical protein